MNQLGSHNAKPPEGRYANLFNVGYNQFEFVLEFGQYYEENGVPSIHTRIVTGPAYVRVLLETLTDSVRTYEEAFGETGTK